MQRGTVLKGALARMPQSPPRPPMDGQQIYAGGNPNFNEQTGRFNAPQRPANMHTMPMPMPQGQAPQGGQFMPQGGQQMPQQSQFAPTPHAIQPPMAFPQSPMTPPLMPPGSANNAGLPQFSQNPFANVGQPIPKQSNFNPSLAPQFNPGANASMYREQIQQFAPQMPQTNFRGFYK